MTKTSSSAAGVSLRVCLGQTGTLQQEETGEGVARGLGNKEKKDKKREKCLLGERRGEGAPHAQARARRGAVLFMLLLSQVLIVPTVHHSQLPACPKQ